MNLADPKFVGYKELLPSIEEMQVDRIGIWKKETVNGESYYKRDTKYSSEWRLWANVHSISCAKKSKRVVLLGESVARGYFLDPYYTPSKLLSEMLNNSIDEEIEVVDLACNGIGLNMLSSLSTDCLDLAPDAIIIYAGNNWFKPFMAFDEKQYVAGSAEEFKIEVEERITGLIKTFVNKLSFISKTNNIPVIFVVPEFNLLDWRAAEDEKILLNYSSNNRSIWHQLKEELEKVVEESDLNKSKYFATQFIEHYPTNPSGYEALADTKIKEGLFEEARRLLEISKDTSIFRPTSSTPRNLEINRKTILLEAQENNLYIVDLPTIFNVRLSTPLPGRKLFLDYCHLSVQGHKISMAALSETLISVLFDKIISAEKLESIVSNPSPEIEAKAHIFAAIHNAHYGQSYDIIQYHCREALKICKAPQIVKFMKLLAGLVTRRLSTHLCSAYEEIVFSGLGEQYNKGTGLLHPDGNKPMDLDLANALVNALKEEGIDVVGLVDALRTKEHSIVNRKANLLESYHRSNVNFQAESAIKQFYKATDIYSVFHFIVEKQVSVLLGITLRSKNGSNDPFKVLLNGNLIWEGKSSTSWQTFSIKASSQFILEGINKIKICWPDFVESISELKTSHYYSSSTDYFKKQLYPVYGEIHMFSAEVE